ncbi:hypothetical protein RRG08_018435 [Elysia crispata]|uniref:G-protein coupled receptors family 1 profile domain-containing protein n=1 Tax=Elysia crispata TaxID=231223 RepID=A0AAE0YTW5_9GAST|nr:hypothetical protein RRG08_018435 [Elysia crispata]
MKRPDLDETVSSIRNYSTENQTIMIPTVSPLMTRNEFLRFLQIMSPLQIAVCAFGIFSNIINILVFYKMGLSSSSNISFFLLAIADACSVSAILIICLQEIFDDSHLPMAMLDVALLTSHAFYFFSAMCSWITTVISMERSCCIIYPLKVKQIFTARNIYALITGMVIYQIATGLPKSLATGLTTTTSPLTNQTITIFDFAKLDMFMYTTSQSISFSLPNLICFIIVLMGTIFFIFSFKQSRQLRKTMSGSGEKSDKMSDKDARLIRLVIFICIIYIVGTAPNTVFFVVQSAYPPLNTTDLYFGNFYQSLNVVANFFQGTASSVNIFVYFRMGSKFKETFKEIFLCRAN